MSNEKINQIFERSRSMLEKEYSDCIKNLKSDIENFKKSTLDKIHI